MNRNEKIFNMCYKYLLKQGASKEEIHIHLQDHKCRKPNQINGKDGLFYKMIEHARNKQGMSNTVDYKPKSKYDINYDPEIDYEFCYLDKILFDFNPRMVLNEYKDYNESELRLRENIKTEILELSETYQKNDNFKKLKKNIENKKNIGNSIPESLDNPKGINYWVTFSKSIISIAEFLSKFDTIDEFNKFISQFDANDDTRISLALLLENEIYGYGFALACDFLKENCNQQYVKPDTHIKYFFYELDLCGEKLKRLIEYKELLSKNKNNKFPSDPEIKKPGLKNEDIEFYKAIMKYSRSIHELPYNTDKLLPYEVDKLFWLVGSGNFYRLDDERKKQIKTDREKFVKCVRQVLG